MGPPVASLGGGSVFVGSSFIGASIVCGSFVFGSSFVMQYLVSFISLQSSYRERESLLLYIIIWKKLILQRNTDNLKYKKTADSGFIESVHES